MSQGCPLSTGFSVALLMVVNSSNVGSNVNILARALALKTPRSGGGGLLPYIGYTCTCGSKGYGFSAALVINRASILADFGHFGHK